MGGNVQVGNIKAEKINLNEIGVENFRFYINKLVNFINDEMGIWKDEDIDSGYVFNGSTSYIMGDIEPDELLGFKSMVGDVDITFPDHSVTELFNFLQSNIGKELYSGCHYVGSNRLTLKSVGNQINCIFIIDFGGITRNVQFDFEIMKFEDNSPTKWGKFSHCSDVRDAKEGIKSVHHKYLIRAIVGAMSYDPMVKVVTAKSTHDSWKLSQSRRDQEARMLKFSVGRGLRESYSPLLDDNDEIVTHGGFKLYKMKDTKTDTYITEIEKIIEKIFGAYEDSYEDKFMCFSGLIELLKKHATQEQIALVTQRYIQLLWGTGRSRGQELERGLDGMDNDKELKLKGFNLYKKMLSVDIDVDLNEYYKDYGSRC